MENTQLWRITAGRTVTWGRETMVRMIQLAAGVLALVAGLLAADAGAAELKVLSAGAMRGALQELAPAFETASGHKLKIEYATAGVVELKPKTRLVAAAGAQGPRVGTAVASGEAEIGLQPISELIEVEGIDIVGPLPAELQSPDLVYVAGSPFFSEQPIPAKALIDFLADPKAAAVYKAKGMQPG